MTRRHLLRLPAAMGLVLVKLLLVLAGAVGAAISSVITGALLLRLLSGCISKPHCADGARPTASDDEADE